MDPRPSGEARRVGALRALQILDTPPEAHFDAVCRTARGLFGVAIAAVSFIDEDRLWFKARCGLDVEETPRQTSFCTHAILDDDVLVVEDAARDPRFRDNPWVTAEAGVRFYAGAPLVLEDGIRIGTLCLADSAPRTFGPEEREALGDLAAIVVAHLRLHQAGVAAEEGARRTRATEAALRERDRLLTMAEQVAHVGHWRVTYPACHLLWSEEVYRIHDRDPASFTPGPVDVAAAYHPDDRDRVIAHFAEAVAAGHDFEFDARLVRPDGEVRQVCVRALCERDAMGALAAIFGVLIDVTARRRAEAELREKTALLEATLAHMDQGLVAIDAEGVVQLCNARAMALLDLAPGFMGERPSLAALVAHQDAAGEFGESAETASWFGAHDPWPPLREALRDGPEIYERVRPNGTALEIRTVRLPSGGAIRSFSDVTERRARETALAEANRAAEAARAGAEAASQAKTEFLASMSHEIRTPLNGIIGYADLLREEGGLAPAQARHVERIQGAGAALLTVVNDILDFSTIEAGRVELEHHAFSPRALVDDAVGIVRAMAERKHLTLRVELDPNLPERLAGDPDRLRQVLLNLLNNAIKFTPVGGVTLRVDGTPGEGGHVLRFAVEDTGIGIRADKRHRLFQRFSQLDGSIRREFGGTGLGLAISQSLVSLMGGTIGVESAEGWGSTFVFSVALEAAPCEMTAPAPARTDAAACGARILLVEDVEMNQALARAILERAGYAVEVVGDGADAILAVQRTVYDLVLMDVQMPGTDGLTATRAIRALTGPAGLVPIVAMTANVLPDQIAAVRAAGMDGHVGKPFKQPDLLAVVVRWVHARGEASTPAPVLDEDVFAGLTDLVGAATAMSLLGRLAVELGERFRASAGPMAADGRAQLARDAHAMVSAAGMLGFAGLSAQCRALEEACTVGGDPSALLADLARTRDAVLAEIATRRAA